MNRDFTLRVQTSFFAAIPNCTLIFRSMSAASTSVTSVADLPLTLILSAVHSVVQFVRYLELAGSMNGFECSECWIVTPT